MKTIIIILISNHTRQQHTNGGTGNDTDGEALAECHKPALHIPKIAVHEQGFLLCIKWKFGSCGVNHKAIILCNIE